MSTSRSQEGLEVSPFQSPPREHDLPILYDGNFGTTTSEKPQLPGISSESAKDVLPISTTQPGSSAQPRRRLRQQWVIALIVLLVVIAAVVGGAVGGTRASKKSNEPDSDPPPTPNPTSSGDSLPTSSQPSACRGGICPVVLKSVSWPGTQFIFGLSAAKSLVYKSGDGQSWDSTWTDLGGGFIYPPTVVSWGDGRIDVMGVGTNKAMFWKFFQNNIWSSDWISLGGQFTSAPSAACWGPQRIDLFGAGTDGALWHSYWDGQGGQNWATWESLGGIILGGPSAAAWGDQRLDIFARGTDRALWHISWDGIWHPWESLGGILVSEPVVVSSAVHLLDIFGLGLQNTLCWRGYHNAWLDWQCLGDKAFESVPAPVVLKSDRVDVLGIGSDDHVYHKSMVGSTWSSSWDDLGGPVNSAPAAAPFSSSQVAVFGVGMDSEMFTSNCSSTSFAWECSSGWANLGGNFTSVV